MRPECLIRADLLPEGSLVAAVSGGLDSMVLLHQLRFGPEPGRPLVVAHLDHAMRPGSAADALWLRGVCRAWGVPLVSERLPVPPDSEASAREARYRFLEGVRSTVGASTVVLAHHADDQAETVLFRVLRGTGVRGLAGMPPIREGVVRPLLGRWRGELEAYARVHGVPHREDPTNRDPAYARNALRHRILPEAEARVAAGSRSALVRLAENAARAGHELSALESVLFRQVILERGPGRVEVPVETMRALPPAVRRRLLRAACRRLGVTLERTATDTAVAAVERFRPGQGLHLTAGLRLERGMSEWIFLGPAGISKLRPGGIPVVVSGDGAGREELVTPGARYRIRWGGEPSGVPGEVVLPGREPFPLTFRGWTAGDRIRLPYGSKPVVKLLAERGVPRVDRPSVAVCLDARGSVVWVPGVAESTVVSPPSRKAGGERALYMTCDRLADA